MIPQPEVVDERFDFVLFTNEVDEAKVGVWEVRPIDYKNRDTTRVARYIKTHPESLLPEYNVSVADRPMSSSSSSSSSSSQQSSSSAGWRNIPLQSEITKALPMTGIVFWATNYPGSTYNDATSLEYLYCYPSKVVTGRNSDGSIQYNWSSLETLLNQVKNRQHQAIVRIAYENPNNSELGSARGSTAVPAWIKALNDYSETFSADPGGDGPTYYAGWGHDTLKWFAKQFLADFAAKYDTDSRVAFLQIGFGHWGEYHISGTTLNLGTNFPSKDFQDAYLRQAASVFQHLPWAFSIDAGSSSRTPIVGSSSLMALGYGIFDDSFMHSEHEISQGGDYNEVYWNKLDYPNHYGRSAMGGEINCWNDYYDHKNFLSPSGVHGLTWADQAAKYHISYMLAGHVIYGSYGTPSHLLQGALASGYKFRVTRFRTNGTQTQATVKNEGVAPIYRDAYLALNGSRSSSSLKGLLPGDSLTVTFGAPGSNPSLTIESSHLVGRPIQYLADLN